jgi:hypothetical protein
VNQTGGKVSDADARLWAGGILRTVRYGLWATTNLEQAFLINSGLSDAPNSVFGSNLKVIAQARLYGARQIMLTPPTIRRVVLRVVPPQLEPTFATAGSKWAPYSFYLDEQGPYSATIVDAQARTVAIDQSLPPGAGAAELVSGHFSDDPVLGAIWVAGSDWDCTNSASRERFGSLCVP